MPTTRKRSIQVKVTITPELHARLREVSELLGQAPATVASMAIGQYVSQLATTLGAGQRAVDAVAAQVAPELAEAIRAQSRLFPGGAAS